MSTLVTVSEIDKSRHIPSRQERDDAFSSGAGRKAQEKIKADRRKHLHKGYILDVKSCESQEQKRPSLATKAPVGLELETRFMPAIGTALETKAKDS